MTTSIKSVTNQECKNIVNNLFGNLSIEDIAVVNLSSIDDSTNKFNSIRVASIQDFKDIVQSNINKQIVLDDVVLLSSAPEFEIKSTNTTGLKEKLKDLGFDNLDLSNVAIVNAEDLDSKSENTNDSRKVNRFRK